MNQIFGIFLLLSYLFAFIIGFSSILYSIIYYFLERVIWLKYYIVFLFTFGILLIIRSLRLFSFFILPNFIDSIVFDTLYYFTFSISMSILFYFIPSFLYRFLSINWTTVHNIIYLLLSVIFFIISIFGILFNFNFYIFANFLFFLGIIYFFTITVLNYNNIEDNTIKIIVRILGIATIIILPVLIYYIIRFRGNISDIVSMDIILLLYYIWWNLIILSYFVWYFISIIKSRNIFYSTDSNITNSDSLGSNNKESFNLTKRENEILSYLLSGKTNKEISLILDISLNTVNNHVANIYDKSGVKNRVELVNKFK